MDENDLTIPQEEFQKYIVSIKGTPYQERVAYFLHEGGEFLPDIRDILVTNPQDDENAPQDLWMFLEGCCVKVKDFSKVAEEPEMIELQPLNGKAKCVHITKQNYSFIKPDERRIRGGPNPNLEISIKLEDDQTLNFKAAGVANCKHLLEIYQKHFALKIMKP
jgi:hypothetical protein